MIMYSNAKPVKVSNSNPIITHIADASLFEPLRYDSNITVTVAEDRISA